MSMIFVIVSWSVGAIIAFVGFGIAYLFTKVWVCNMKKSVNFIKFYIGVLIYNVLLVSELLLKPLRYIIVKIFNKDITLSGRVYLWRTVLSELGKNLFLSVPLISTVIALVVNTSGTDALKFFIA